MGLLRGRELDAQAADPTAGRNLERAARRGHQVLKPTEPLHDASPAIAVRAAGRVAVVSRLVHGGAPARPAASAHVPRHRRRLRSQSPFGRPEQHQHAQQPAGCAAPSRCGCHVLTRPCQRPVTRSGPGFDRPAGRHPPRAAGGGAVRRNGSMRSRRACPAAASAAFPDGSVQAADWRRRRDRLPRNGASRIAGSSSACPAAASAATNVRCGSILRYWSGTMAAIRRSASCVR